MWSPVNERVNRTKQINIPFENPGLILCFVFEQSMKTRTASILRLWSSYPVLCLVIEQRFAVNAKEGSKRYAPDRGLV